MTTRWWNNWIVRHQHPVSRVLHAIGIPLTVLAGVLAVVQWADGAWNLWWRPLGLFVLGYLFQWIGHRIEGNTLGEWIVVCKWLGWPYTAVSPRNRHFDDYREQNEIQNEPPQT